MLTTLVFDLDGTLADTPAGIAATIAAVLAEMGYAPPAAEAVLSHCGILPLFDAVFGSDRTSLPKPHPELALKLLAELGSDPAQAMVVGDTSYDILMGKGAGARTCAVTYGVHPRHQLEAAGPDYIIDRF